MVRLYKETAESLRYLLDRMVEAGHIDLDTHLNNGDTIEHTIEMLSLVAPADDDDEGHLRQMAWDQSVVDDILDILSKPHGVSGLGERVIRELRELLLPPKDIREVKAKLRELEGACPRCGRKFPLGSAVSYLRGSHGESQLYCVRCYTPESVMGEDGQAQPIPESIMSELHRLARQGVPVAQPNSHRAVPRGMWPDAPPMSATISASTAAPGVAYYGGYTGSGTRQAIQQGEETLLRLGRLAQYQQEADDIVRSIGAIPAPPSQGGSNGPE